jgi:hypothetical protein
MPGIAIADKRQNRRPAVPITVKLYRCPTCGHEEEHSTNHTGEIYCNCKACGNSPLYCAEVDPFEGRPFVTARLVCYRFTLEDDQQRKQYAELKSKLRQEHGYKVFASLDYSPAGHKHLFSFAAWREHDGETVRLYDPEQFTNQYVSNLGRVFDWKEAIYPNRKIKEGYYLVRL